MKTLAKRGASGDIGPIMEHAARLRLALDLGLLAPGDVAPPWDDIVIAYHAGLMERATKRGGAESYGDQSVADRIRQDRARRGGR